MRCYSHRRDQIGLLGWGPCKRSAWTAAGGRFRPARRRRHTTPGTGCRGAPLSAARLLLLPEPHWAVGCCGLPPYRRHRSPSRRPGRRPLQPPSTGSLSTSPPSGPGWTRRRSPISRALPASQTYGDTEPPGIPTAASRRSSSTPTCGLCKAPTSARMAPFTRRRSDSFDWTSTEVGSTSQTSPPRFMTSTPGSIPTRAACSGRSRCCPTAKTRAGAA